MAAAVSYSPRRPPPSTSYKPSASTLPQSKRNHDFIRPRLPTDPFSNNAFRQRDPIVLNAERLFHTASTSHPRRDVILVLGVPSTKDLAPLFNSERLAFSLLIIASHQPPLVPPKVQPAVRILRLTAPLGLEQAGAIRFVNTLEWAERVARVWRKEGGIGVRELTESDQDGFGALTPPPNGASSRSSVSAPSGPFRHLTLLNGPSMRSRPFLVAATPPSHSPPTRPSAPKRGSVFSRISIYSMPPTPPLGSRDSLSSLVTGTPFSQSPQIKSRLVHLLAPRPRNSVTNRVLHSIESFLLSFSFPPALEIKNTDGLEPARACLLESAAFAEPIGTPPSLNINWTVADILLSGCLDDEPSPRAWLSGAADIIVASPPTQHSPPIARLDPHSPALLDVNTRSNLGISALPTPPDSEEDMSSRHSLPAAKGS
ncbi:hypothetical protein EDB83DRAFT_2360404, partial [Lactarius deliciosus]